MYAFTFGVIYCGLKSSLLSRLVLLHSLHSLVVGRVDGEIEAG